MENIQRIILKNKNIKNTIVPIVIENKKNVRTNYSILINLVKVSEKKVQKKKFTYLMIGLLIFIYININI